MNRENVLLLLPFHGKPLHVLPNLMDFLNELCNSIGSKINIIKICFYSAPLGIVPFELDDVYPVSQMQASYIDKETEGHVLNSIDVYIRKVKHNHIILYMDEKNEISQLLNIKLSRTSQNIGFNLQVIQPEYQVWSKESTKLLSEKITQVLELVKELK